MLDSARKIELGCCGAGGLARANDHRDEEVIGMIPKIIHYVWCGSAFPERYQGYIDSWREHNPGYQFILWNETNIDFDGVPMLAELYRTRKYNKVSDVVRHMALLSQGGIYLDTDFQVFRPLDRMLQYACFYGFQCVAHPTDWVGTGVVAAEPNHWFIAKVLARMMASRNSYMGVDIPTAIGPKLITSMLRDEGLKHYSEAGVFVGDVFVCPWHWFYPFGMDEVFTPECVREDTLAAHFWDKSWDQYTSRSTRFLRGARSLVRRAGVRA
jgi:mannosyltransferase OCH1-like enzyme